MQFSHPVSFPLFIFLTVTNRFFFFSLFSSSFHFLSNFSTSSLFLQKLCLPLISSSIHHQKSLSQTLSFPPMAPKTKKPSYLITSDVFNLTHQVRATRLNESPPLLYKPNDHLSDNARARLVSFSNFSHFQVLL